MSLPLVIVIAYMGALFLIGGLARRRTRSTEQYLLAGRGFGVPLVAVSLVGLAIGGAATIGVAERAYSTGLAAGWYNVGWTGAAIVMALFAAGPYRRSGAATVPEFFERIYGPGTRVLCALCQLAVLLVIAALQYRAGGAILASLLPDVFDYRGGVTTSAAVFIALAFIGGMWSSGVANVVNVSLIFIGINAAGLLVVAQAGGFAALAAPLPRGTEVFNPFAGASLAALLTPAVAMIVTQFAFQAPLQIAAAARHERIARRGFLIAGLFILPSGFMAAVVGIAAAAAHPGIDAAQALPQTVLGMDPWLAGLLLASLWAADVSTAVALLLACSALVRTDLLGALKLGGLVEHAQLRWSRLFVLGAGLATYALTLTFPDRIITTLLFYLTLMTAFSVAFAFAIYAPRLCRRSSAAAAVVACALVLVLWQLVPAWRIGPHPVYVALPASVLAFLAAGLVDRRAITTLPTASPAPTSP